MNHDFSIRFKNYKCFTEENVLENIKSVNLLIGKNNCGKTSVLDVIERVLSNNKRNALIDNCVIDYKTTINDTIYSSTFSPNAFMGISFYDSRNSLFELGKQLLHQECFFPLQNSNHIDPLFVELSKKNSQVFSKDKWDNLKRLVSNSIEKYSVYKISAERDIKREKRESGAIYIDSNGDGITRYVEKYLHDSKGNYKLIKEDVLNSLNEILKGESNYSDIEVLNEEEYLEIYLYENDKRIPLSLMGSGLKTILFVLLQLFVSDETSTNALFLFEELENNLHPEIQRRLLNFIYDFVVEHNSLAFITSHSHVAINCFYGKDDASIYHIHKNANGSSVIESIANDIDKASILSDLGVLASDIFQTNGIVWVEGPSDRIYIKKWLAVKYPELKENEDYTFLFYGGKNLAHFTADSEQENNLINVLLTNRNGLIVMDHDGDSASEDIRDTKKRVKEEFESKEMFVWITQGKEIENYLKADDVNKAIGSGLKQVEPFEPFVDYISSAVNNFANQKISFSQKIEFNNDSLRIMDLENRIDDIASIIKKWNSK